MAILSPSDRQDAPDATVVSGAAPASPARGAPGEGGWRLGSTVDDRYRLEAELGRGAMGIVYRANEVWLDRTVAIKVIAPALLSDSTAPVGLHREAKALAAIRNEHVVRVHAFGEHQGSYFFVMEYVRGRSLKDLLAEHEAHGMAIPVHRTLTVIAQIAEGIAAVQQAGLVHRDVKPSNIIIEEDTGRPVLVDFGLVTVTSGSAAPASLIMGTPLYMAPEQTGLAEIPAAISGRTDVYALACTAFEMLAGRPPFQGDDAAELRRRHALSPPPLLSSIRPELAAFDPVLSRALAKAPHDRQESCVELASELALAATRGHVHPHGQVHPHPPGAAPVPVERNAPLRVLVVDLDPEFSRIAAQAVHAAFYRHRKDLRVQIAIAGGGDDAIARASAEPPELVLLDYDLPGLDGGEMLSRLRAAGGGHHARVVVMSRHIPADERWRFSVLGVHDFVTKPTSFLMLVEALQKVAERMGPADPPEPPPRSRRGADLDLAPPSRRRPPSEPDLPPPSRRRPPGEPDLPPSSRGPRSRRF